MNINWRKSSYSGGEGNCVEVADDKRRVLIRDTKDRTGPVLRFTEQSWRRFADQVKRSLASDLCPTLQGDTLAPGSVPLWLRATVISWGLNPREARRGRCQNEASKERS
jgi:Domain of unknown function (DUF397)